MSKDSGTEELRQLVRDLGKMDKEIKGELRPQLKSAADPALADARQRSSWSSRIPGAVSLSVSFTAKRAGVSLRARLAKAPHARAYENQGIPGTFRHPVFGRNTWVTESARPFLWPAAKPLIENIDKTIGEVVDTVARRFDFK